METAAEKNNTAKSAPESIEFKHSGLLVPVIMVGFIIVFLYQSLQVDNIVMNHMIVFPLVAVILILLAVICLQERKSVQHKLKPVRFKKESLNKQITFYLILVGFLVMQHFIGFLISSSVMLIVSFYVVGARNMKMVVPLSILGPLIIFMLFRRLFYVVLPQGPLEKFIVDYVIYGFF